MSTFQPASNLRSRTFLGLLVAQFFAAFNDQAIHASSMFFAINTGVMDEAKAISLMPILFYAPWALFCTLAGYYADRYSKRNSLVFWKIAEVGITLIALAGFWIGRNGSPSIGAYLVLSTVFLMGMHSAFFVPAKYGAMPEILQPHMLSRGNGVLESLSFLAVILGTVVGGVLSYFYRGEEYLIGLILLGLALIGALASLLIRRMPAANPGRRFPPYIYQPLVESIRGLLRSRPLALTVVGIAFFTFLVAFMRATVYMHGESQVPRWTELKTSLIVGMVALGIGIGSPLVGFLSGGKVELGLVPIGSLGMTIAAMVAAAALGKLEVLIVCIIALGFFTGFYIVPLFTLLQHRAPKTSKGDAIATSNFINVVGAIIASAVFFAMTWIAHRTDIAPPLTAQAGQVVGPLDSIEYEEGHPHRIVVDGKVFESQEKPGHAYRYIKPAKGLTLGEEVVLRTYTLDGVTYYRVQKADAPEKPPHNNKGLPRLLFLSAGGLTLFTLLLLWWQMPDLFLRMVLWLRIYPRYRLEVAGMNHLPSSGPVLLVTNAAGIEAVLQVLSSTDRTTRFLLVEGEGPTPSRPLLTMAARTSLALLRDGTTTSAAAAQSERLVERARRVLDHGDVVGLALEGGNGPAEDVLSTLARTFPILPVYHELAPAPSAGRRRRVHIVAGTLLPSGTTLECVRREVKRLGEQLRSRDGERSSSTESLLGAH